MKKTITRRSVLKGSAALAATTAFAQPLRAAPPAPEAITPALIEAAKKEGKCSFYTAMDLEFAERLGKTFEQKFPGIAVRVERSGAERVFTRIAQEYQSNIAAVDVANTADQAHVIIWKKEGWLLPFLPQEVVENYDKTYYDPEGFEVVTRVLVSPFGINTNLVKMEDAPKSFADLLDPKWAGKMVKAHPAYSGTIMNATFQIARDLGWGYLEKLAKQRVLQVQSATDTPKKIALGERAIMIDGAGYLVIRNKEAGQPVDVIYPAEGTPVATSPSVVFKRAPNPNAAKLFQSWMHGREGQQLLVDFARQYSAHKQTVEKPGVRKLADIKLMKEDPEGVEKGADEIKRRYGQIFRV
ncbi:extracellular solute-binding protein [Leptospira sp. severe_002]|uniref:extracellular solute-binding protein n=1 Tax=Leptospira sp. severe_002 TaxID=2838237 RepID=UPI001E5EC5E2|nr:extracellular solute-binding protein [Leptospira sp. severe_002]